MHNVRKTELIRNEMQSDCGRRNFAPTSQGLSSASFLFARNGNSGDMNRQKVGHFGKFQNLSLELNTTIFSNPSSRRASFISKKSLPDDKKSCRASLSAARSQPRARVKRLAVFRTWSADKQDTEFLFRRIFSSRIRRSLQKSASGKGMRFLGAFTASPRGKTLL